MNSWWHNFFIGSIINIARGTTDPGYWVHYWNHPDSRITRPLCLELELSLKLKLIQIPVLVLAALFQPLITHLPPCAPPCHSTRPPPSQLQPSPPERLKTYRYCCQHDHNLRNSMQVQHHLADPLGDLLVEIVHVNLLGIALPINGIISSQVLRPTWRGTWLHHQLVFSWYHHQQSFNQRCRRKLETRHRDPQTGPQRNLGPVKIASIGQRFASSDCLAL